MQQETRISDQGEKKARKYPAKPETNWSPGQGGGRSNHQNDKYTKVPEDNSQVEKVPKLTNFLPKINITN